MSTSPKKKPAKPVTHNTPAQQRAAAARTAKARQKGTKEHR